MIDDDSNVEPWPFSNITDAREAKKIFWMGKIEFQEYGNNIVTT